MSDRSATGVFSSARAQIARRTLRSDRWWLSALWTDLGLATFVIYATTRAFWRSAYYVPEYHYLSPFESPCLSASCVEGSHDLGVWFGDFPRWIPLGMLVLPFVLAFRLTCYYYRKAYYRSVWQSPPACSVAEPHSRYSGETRFPLIVQNSHRYFFYVALLVALILTFDVVNAFRSPSGFGVGLGTIVLAVNVILVWVYTFSCHSCRHAVGGRLKHFSKHPVRYWLWTQVTKLNTRHMLFAWLSLGSLAFTDVYIMLVASGTIHDLRIIG